MKTFTDTPPNPPLAFHVGVTGHRLDATTKRPVPDLTGLQPVIHEVLALIRDAVLGVAVAERSLFSQTKENSDAPAETKLRLLSALAEGADRWVAKDALALGYELQAVLPFARNEYANDFSGSARDEYAALLQGEAGAPVVFELDGTRHADDESYLASGRQILQQADLLIAVWDGKAELGKGGTGQVVRDALLFGVPVIWIEWGLPTKEPWRLLTDPTWRLLERLDDRDGDAVRLKAIVTEILLPADRCANRCHLEPDSLRPTFGEERAPHPTLLGAFWNCMLGAISPRKGTVPQKQPPVRRHRSQNFMEATRQTWAGEEESLAQCGKDAEWAAWATEELRKTNDHYVPHFAWANHLSLHYGNLYRGSFALNYFLGALAVGLALVGGWLLMNHGCECPWIAAELVTIAAVVIITLLGRKRRWHQRWIEYRTLAERLRLSRLMTLLGGWRQQGSMPGHLARYGDPVNSWVYWHCRAVERAAGFPNGSLDGRRLRLIKFCFLEGLAQGQIDYHSQMARRFGAADRRLHALANGFFIATFVLCVAHLAIEFAFPNLLTVNMKAMTIGLNAVLPAFGAALAAIRNQGEFRRLSRRSEAMEQALTGLRRELSMIAPEGAALKSVEMRRVIERIARIMLDETLDWRIVFQDHPTDFPA